MGCALAERGGERWIRSLARWLQAGARSETLRANYLNGVWHRSLNFHPAHGFLFGLALNGEGYAIDHRSVNLYILRLRLFAFRFDRHAISCLVRREPKNSLPTFVRQATVNLSGRAIAFDPR